MMASTTSMMRCRAESVPMVMSVPQKSLSMEPTIPTMCSVELEQDSCSVIRPADGHRHGETEPRRDITFSGRKVTLLEKLLQQAAPLFSEQVGTGQAAVSTNHTQVSDAVLYQIVSGLQTSLMSTEIFAAGTANDGSALTETQGDAFSMIFIPLTSGNVSFSFV